jgi:hypothetical protein
MRGRHHLPHAGREDPPESPVASQARQESVSRMRTFASRIAGPAERASVVGLPKNISVRVAIIDN